MSNVQICEICRCTSFEIIDGHFFCTGCLTQNDNVQENVQEGRVDSTTRTKSLGKIKTKKVEKPAEIEGWTSWELYNFILHGLTNEAIELGAPPEIKLTVLQLWTTYLRKIEVAFTSKKKKLIPKLARKFKKRDAEILYGRIQQLKRRKRRKGSTSVSSMISSFQSTGSVSSKTSKTTLGKILAEKYEKASSANDSLSSFSGNQSLVSLQSSFSQGSSTRTKLRYNKAARQEAKKVKKNSKKISYPNRGRYQKEHVSTQYRLGPQVLTPLKLWVILYLALRIHDSNIHLTDMLRYGREGHLSYHKLDHLLPPEVSMTRKDVHMLSQPNELTHKGFRKIAAGVAKFLEVELDEPDFQSLVEQYCKNLQLPRGILLYTEKLLALATPKMRFNEKSPCTPNYEGRAMAFIVVVMKILFGLDGITEYEISRVVEKMNRQARERGIVISRLFSFREWQRFIECRRSILSDTHFPSKLKYDPESPGNTHLYLRFLGLMQSKREGEQPKVVDYRHSLPELLSKGFKTCFQKLNENILPMDDITIFSPSLTPQESYIQQLLNDPSNDLPEILKVNFFDTKVGYTTNPELFQELAGQCGMKLKVVNTNLHFIEKKVPEFENSKMPTVQSLNEIVIVKEPEVNTNISVKSENLFDYIHRKTECKVTVNNTKKEFYDKIKTSIDEESECTLTDDFSFDLVRENGKLLIQDEIDPEDEDFAAISAKEDLGTDDKNSVLKDQFCKIYNLSLLKHEMKAALRTKSISSKRRYVERIRDSKGRYVKKSNEASEDEDNKVNTESDEESIASTSNSEEDDISILKDFNESRKSKTLENYLFIRPFKNYWIYNCIFSRVKPKNFELFEKELPVSFRWLLRECAGVVEMSTLDLYEEICLVEAYFSHILKTGDEKKKTKVSIDKKYRNSILSKW